MKKIALVAVLPFALALTACGGEAEETTPVDATATEAVVEPMPAETVAPDAMATDAVVTDEATPAADATETPAAEATEGAM